MINYIQEGDRLLFPNVSGSTILAGAGVLVGVRVGVAVSDIPTATSGILAVEGVYTLPKLSTDVVAQGVLLYWDNTNKRLTVTSAGNTQAGYAFAAAGNGVTTVDIKINE